MKTAVRCSAAGVEFDLDPPGAVSALRKALSRERSLADEGSRIRFLRQAAVARLPRLEGLGSEGAKRAAVNEMALNVESVVDGGVNRQEALC